MPEPRKRNGRKPTALTKSRDKAVADAGGLDVLYAHLAAGQSINAICKAIGLPVDMASYKTVHELMTRDRERYDAARRESADAHAELAGAVYGEEAPESTAKAKWLHDRSGWHRWMSDLYSGRLDKSNAGVTLNIGALHLEALKASGSIRNLEARRVPMSAADRMLESGQVVEAEVEVLE
jgi:hypothetical protein